MGVRGLDRGDRIKSRRCLVLLHRAAPLPNESRTSPGGQGQPCSWSLLTSRVLPDSRTEPPKTTQNCRVSRYGRGYWVFVRFCTRSEERRVGKECRSRWSPCH